MSALFGKIPVVPRPGPPPPLPKLSDPNVQDAANEARLAARNAAGRASTILTSGVGAPGTPSTTKKQTLGG